VTCYSVTRIIKDFKPRLIFHLCGCRTSDNHRISHRWRQPVEFIKRLAVCALHAFLVTDVVPLPATSGQPLLHLSVKPNPRRVLSSKRFKEGPSGVTIKRSLGKKKRCRKTQDVHFPKPGWPRVAQAVPRQGGKGNNPH